MITQNASEKIRQFNERGLHYNLVADAVYSKRKLILDPFDPKYFPYIIAALISFDMERMMGAPAESKYNPNMEGFAYYLLIKLKEIRPKIGPLVNLQLEDISSRSEKENIKKAYNILALEGKDGLNRTGGKFHVGATKVLHFLNPEVFIIVDSNAARAFRESHGIKFRKSAPQGYSGDKYIDCMEHAKMDILNFGIKEFRTLEDGVPITRIYDKLTFITGSSML